MSQAGARHCVDVAGTFCGQDFRGADTEQQRDTPMAAQPEPSVPRVPMIRCLDAHSLCEIAEFLHINVQDLIRRYDTGEQRNAQA
jgi:hypothetical protein